MAQPQPSKEPMVPNWLTKREETGAIGTEGLRNRDMSRRRGLTEHTVRHYLFRIFNQTRPRIDGTAKKKNKKSIRINKEQHIQVEFCSFRSWSYCAVWHHPWLLMRRRVC